MRHLQFLRTLGTKALPFLLLFGFTIPAPHALAGQAAQESATADSVSTAEYLLGIGDLIEVQVWKEPDLSRTLRVRLDGRISLPLIGEVEAAGKSPAALAAVLKERLRELIAEPAVSVMLSESNRRYYVIGKVVQPGEFALDGKLTVLQALARSGGFQEWADTSKIEVIRRGQENARVLRFDYETVVKGADPKLDPLIAPGDTIIVP